MCLSSVPVNISDVTAPLYNCDLAVTALHTLEKQPWKGLWRRPHEFSQMLVEVDAGIAGIIVDYTIQALGATHVLQIPTVHFMSSALSVLSVCSTSHFPFTLTLDNLGALHLPLLPCFKVGSIFQNFFVVKLQMCILVRLWQLSPAMFVVNEPFSLDFDLKMALEPTYNHPKQQPVKMCLLTKFVPQQTDRWIGKFDVDMVWGSNSITILVEHWGSFGAKLCSENCVLIFW